MLIICDIDGTVADHFPRLEKAGKMPPRKNISACDKWLAVFQDKELLLKDTPIREVRELLLALDNRLNIIVYLTGRSRKYEDATRNWLQMHGFPNGQLYMRDNDDYKTPAEYKEAQLDRIINRYKRNLKKSDIIVLDDDYEKDCNKVYLKKGLVHLKVYYNKNYSVK